MISILKLFCPVGGSITPIGKFIAHKTLKLITKSAQYHPEKLRVAVLGVTFKENVSDLRNTKVIDVIEELESFGIETFAFDPVASDEDFHHEYGRHLTRGLIFLLAMRLSLPLGTINFCRS